MNDTIFKKTARKYLLLKKKWSPQQNLFYGFLTYVLIGFILLLLPFSTKGSIPVLDSLFTATSAVSTTGLTTVPIANSYTFFGQLVITFLIQLGGIGYLSFTTFMILSTTRKITNWHKRILSTEFTLPNTLQITDFLKSVILFTLVMETVGAILFFIAFTNDGMETKGAIWSAIFHSVSSFCTAGFSLFDNNFISYVDDYFINGIIAALAISGSLGFIVITDFMTFIKNKKHKLTFTSKIIIFGLIILFVFGTTFFYFLEPTISSLTGHARFLAAFFQCMSAITTVGFNSVDLGSFTQAMMLVCIFLMYVGASPSGTAGGIKITTLTAVLAIVKSRLQGSKNVTFLGKKIPYERLYIATAAFIFYTALIVFGTFLITLTHKIKFEDILFEVASALGTVGVSTGITATLSSFGKSVLIVLMFVGRIGVLTFGLAIWERKEKETKLITEDIAL
ncbi:potassium transporter TrkH [Polaribacter sp.]|nr:potassium transporter TrkH [Polaribacter sp.]